MWNLYSGFTGNATFHPTAEFFNRHAPSGAADPAVATAAFVSFVSRGCLCHADPSRHSSLRFLRSNALASSQRDSLDTTDVARFPTAEFGPVNLTYGHTQQLNGTRMQAIATAMASYGARVNSVAECRSTRSISQKKGMFLNDVGYRIWPGNCERRCPFPCWISPPLLPPRAASSDSLIPAFSHRADQKFMRQLNASASSVGRWRLGPMEQPYGRFARALDQATARTAIRTALAPRFANAHRDPETRRLLNVSLRVVYFDEGEGEWALTFPAASGGRGTAMSVVKAGSGRWVVAEATVVMAPTDGDGSFDFELRSLHKKDEVFSLMEVLVHPRE